MIDIESQVFNAVYNAVIASYPSAYITSSYTPTPEALPCVYLSEVENIAVKSTRDTASNEKHCALGYKCEVYTTGGKTEAKAIAQIVNNKMQDLGFTRTTYTPADNLYDASVTRILMLWTAIVDTDQKIYRR